jgi:hypothetical protein
LSGCDDTSSKLRRNVYETRAECEADYPLKECESQARGNGTGFFFLGPFYSGNWRSRDRSFYAAGGGPGRAALASPKGVVSRGTVTERGGFGSTGHTYGAGG